MSTMKTTTDTEITAAARLAFRESKDATGDDGCAFEAANEAIAALVGTRTGFFDQETLTWTSDEVGGRYLVQAADADTGESLYRDSTNDLAAAERMAREAFASTKAHADVTDTETGAQVFHTAN
jgi:hypothetical protein